MIKFSEIGLQEKLLLQLKENNYNTLTPIQEKIIPAIQNGNDVLGCSQTGSGKTGAFLIPIISDMMVDKNKKAIIITPTRELAIQIMDNIKIFCGTSKSITKALLIGGASIQNQYMSIRNGNTRLIVGTPGRINDFLASEKLKIDDFNILVLDEMDRMLDMGFSSQIDKIISNIKVERQTMLFSATMSKKIEKITNKYLKNPVVIKIGETNQPSVNISQDIVEIENKDKFTKLLEYLKESKLFTIVFIKTKYGTERIANKLDKLGIMAKAIHGDLRQNKRARIIQDFRDKKFNVLIATDVAARGLDIPHVDRVINYDLPQSPEDYIHRIGRCSRGLETKGISISFCNRDDKKLLNNIESLIKNGEYSEIKQEKSNRNGGKMNKKKTLKYDIEGLMATKKRAGNAKRPSTYLVSNTTAKERRERLGLNNKNS